MQTCQGNIALSEGQIHNFERLIKEYQQKLKDLANSSGDGQDKSVLENKYKVFINYYEQLKEDAEDRLESYNNALAFLI